MMVTVEEKSGGWASFRGGRVRRRALCSRM